MGALGMEKFNKSTFMNIATYAENNGAKSLILIQDRDHTQKGTTYLPY
jgi:hypothetical protein